MRGPTRSLVLAAALGLTLLWGRSESQPPTPSAPRPAAAPRGAAAPVQAPKPAGGPSCVTGQCHDEMGKERYVHGPVAAGECTKCHVPLDPKTMYDGERHAFRLIRAEEDLCYLCHEQRLDSQKVVHGPVRFGLCGACHDPHQSPYRYRLRKSPPSELCYQCHDRDKTREKEVHGPVAEGEAGSFDDDGLDPGKIYRYRVRARDPDDDSVSGWSPVARRPSWVERDDFRIFYNIAEDDLEPSRVALGHDGHPSWHRRLRVDDPRFPRSVENYTCLSASG